MTNHEKYKQAFSAVHISDNFSLEVNEMVRTNKTKKIRGTVAGIAACALLFGSSFAAYAADVGGIQRTVQLWLNGDQTQVTINFTPEGKYLIEYPDKEGNPVRQGGGGVAIDDDGSERPLTESELLEDLNAPEVRYEDDGSVWVYYFDQKIDITDRFEDNVCYVQLSNGKETLYMTVKYQNGWSISPHKYPTPSSFN